MKKIVSFLFFFLLFSACHLGPKYQKPSVDDAPTEWKGPEQAVKTPDVEFWWEVFEDEELNRLESQAVKHNPSLYVALERVIEARAKAGVSFANLIPQLTFNPAYSNLSTKTDLSGLPHEGSGIFRLHQINYIMPLDLSYQLDLWGTYRGQYNSAVFHAQAQEEAYKVALLTLTSDLASAYYLLRTLDAQLDVLQSTIEMRKNAFEINHSRWEAGLVNYSDVSRASLEYTNAQAEFSDAKRLRTIQENRIAQLLGIPSSSFTMPHSPLKNAPPEVPAGLPSTALLRRPDVAEAERNMASQQALIGVAKAAFFPQISLTGAIGLASPDLKNLLSWQSRLWEIGAAAAQTVIDGGRNSSNLDVAWAQFRQASGGYQAQVLLAFGEVENSLSNIEWQALQFASLQKSVDSAKLTTSLSSERYNKGLVTYLDVVDSEREELQVEISALHTLGQRYISTIQLIKAIGGTWVVSASDVLKKSTEE
ncbi:MAG: efflux transporter outer membrane subunit [Chlamydiae bacterium]|nr:efflux transporter outer membrane subunit [Chlamydiota bacterium]